MKHENTMAVVLSTLATLSIAPRVHAFDWFRTANDHVEAGNRRMAARDSKGALAAYDRAARELPSNRGVHLNRGLALLENQQFGRAREAFLLASEPPSDRQTRASAYYNLGLAFYKEADALAKKNQHAQAQPMFRESADAFKRSLRIQPAQRNAAWNLELSMRRIREEEEKQRQEQEKQEQDRQRQNSQNQNQNPDQNQNSPSPQKPEPSTDQNSPPQKNQPSQNQNPRTQNPPPQPENGQQSSKAPLPSDVARVLNALRDSEGNLERQKAHMRAEQEGRRPTKDW